MNVIKVLNTFIGCYFLSLDTLKCYKINVNFLFRKRLSNMYFRIWCSFNNLIFNFFFFMFINVVLYFQIVHIFGICFIKFGSELYFW